MSTDLLTDLTTAAKAVLEKQNYAPRSSVDFTDLLEIFALAQRLQDERADQQEQTHRRALRDADPHGQRL